MLIPACLEWTPVWAFVWCPTTKRLCGYISCHSACLFLVFWLLFPLCLSVLPESQSLKLNRSIERSQNPSGKVTAIIPNPAQAYDLQKYRKAVPVILHPGNNWKHCTQAASQCLYTDMSDGCLEAKKHYSTVGRNPPLERLRLNIVSQPLHKNQTLCAFQETDTGFQRQLHCVVMKPQTL